MPASSGASLPEVASVRVVQTRRVKSSQDLVLLHLLSSRVSSPMPNTGYRAIGQVPDFRAKMTRFDQHLNNPEYLNLTAKSRFLGGEINWASYLPQWACLIPQLDKFAHCPRLCSALVERSILVLNERNSAAACGQPK